MLLFSYTWAGKLAGTNDWTGLRAFPNKNPKAKTPYFINQYKTKKYKDFMNSFATPLQELNLYTEDPIDIELTLTMHKVRDTDNPIKPIMDAIESAMLKNDNQVRNITIRRQYHKRGYQDIINLSVYSVEADPVFDDEEKEFAFVSYHYDRVN